METKCQLLVIGGSAGSLEVLFKVLPEVRTDLPFAIILVIHRKSGKDSMLTDLLSAKTTLVVKEIEEKERIMPSTVYIVPPNYHLLIESDYTFSLDASEKVNFSRPSIDVTFESAADIYGESLTCLLLSGSNNDGTLGLKKVKQKGGKAWIQKPDTATVPYMPQYAKEQVMIDTELDTEQMADFINQL